MTSKSASASFGEGEAFISRSRASSATLDAAENPRMRAGAFPCPEPGPEPCAANQVTPAVAAQNASTGTRKRPITALLRGSRTADRGIPIETPRRGRQWQALREKSIPGLHHGLSAVEIIVGVIEPVLANRAEHIELECILERFGLVLDPRRDVQQLTFAHDELLAADQELQRALQDVGHLLALVRVHRYEAAALQVDLREHLALAGHDLARQHFGDFFQCDLVPSMQTNRLGAHEMEHIPTSPDAIIRLRMKAVLNGREPQLFDGLAH